MDVVWSGGTSLGNKIVDMDAAAFPARFNVCLISRNTGEKLQLQTPVCVCLIRRQQCVLVGHVSPLRHPVKDNQTKSFICLTKQCSVNICDSVQPGSILGSKQPGGNSSHHQTLHNFASLLGCVTAVLSVLISLFLSTPSVTLNLLSCFTVLPRIFQGWFQRAELKRYRSKLGQ